MLWSRKHSKHGSPAIFLGPSIIQIVNELVIQTLPRWSKFPDSVLRRSVKRADSQSAAGDVRTNLMRLSRVLPMTLLVGAMTITSPFAPTINVMEFGAACNWNGTTGTDDSAAFNAALAALTRGKSLFIPGSAHGCRINSALAATGLSNVNIIGDGMGSKLVFTGSLDYGLTLTKANNVRIHNLHFSGASVGQLLRLFAPANVYVEHVFITGGATRIPADGNPGALYVQDNTGDVWIENSTFTQNGPPKPAAASGEDILASATSYVTRVHVRHNRIYDSNTQIDISVINCAFCDISDNDVDQNNAYSGTNADGYGICLHGESEVTVKGTTRTLGGLVTVTTSPHTFTAGEHVNLVGIASSGSTNFNGLASVLAPVTSTTFNYQLPASPAGTPSDRGTGGFASGTVLNATIAHNRVRNSSGSGIYVKSGYFLMILGNTVSHFSQQQNDVSLCSAGIGISGGHNTLSNNTILDSVKDGYCTFVGDDETIIGGSVADVRYGVNFRGGNRHKVSNLHISRTTVGIYSDVPASGLALTDNSIDAGISGRGILFSNLSNSALRMNRVTGGPNSEKIIAGSNNVISDKVSPRRVRRTVEPLRSTRAPRQ